MVKTENLETKKRNQQNQKHEILSVLSVTSCSKSIRAIRGWQCLLPSIQNRKSSAREMDSVSAHLTRAKIAKRLALISLIPLCVTGCQVLTYTSLAGERFTRSSLGANTSIHSLTVKAGTNGTRKVHLNGYDFPKIGVAHFDAMFPISLTPCFSKVTRFSFPHSPIHREPFFPPFPYRILSNLIKNSHDT